MSAQLYVSSKTLQCTKIVEILQQQKVETHVTPNTTITCNDSKSKCWAENGCSILIATLNKPRFKETIWNPIKKQTDVTCGFLQIHDGSYKGCVLNFDTTDHCPGYKA